MSVMDFAGVLDSLSSGTFTVTRRGAGTVSGGIVTPGSASTFSIAAVIQPAGPEHMERMPEGTRIDDTKVIYTRTPLYVSNEATGGVADRISIDGKTYEVESVRDYLSSGTYVQAVARRVDPS